MTQPRLLGGRYELDGVVGRGGMAEVYRARDLRLDRVVAVKTLREDLARDATFQARFRREAQSAASLNHPSIVAVYDTGEDNAGMSHVPFIVMEYVDGRTIRDLLRDDRRLLPERALEIVDGVLRALDYSHRNGIVHRDIKPGNVMLTRNGEIKVMDFGIARAVADTQATMTQTAQVIGTAQYLSPEQARGERVDARSDLYSVGCLLYELLTGRPPFTGDSPVAIAYQHVREAPVPPSRVDPELPSWADGITLRAMEKDPDRRYQSASEMRGDIQRALSGFPVAGPARAGGAYAGAGGPYTGTRRLDPTGGQTQMQGPTGAMPPYEYGPPDGRGRGRSRRPVWPWVSALVALVVIGAAVFAYKTLTGHGTGVQVPNLQGQTVSAAEHSLKQVGLKWKVVSHVSTSPPYNQVTSTSPQAGSLAQKGSQVILNYNVKPGKVAIPAVQGKLASVAVSILQAKGFNPANITQKTVASLTVPSGQVVSISPAVGTMVPLTQQIVLKVSGGGVPVPNVVFLSRHDAIRVLINAGLNYQVITSPGPPTVAPGTVWQQNPLPHKAALKNQVVTIYVQPGSSSPSPTPSPTPSPSPSP
jgi:serine/threonine-protein kinase